MPGHVVALAINEVFGPTIQGEGRHAGTPCAFVRLARCNLDCTWCDTPYTWDWQRFDPTVEVHRWPVAQVAEVATLLCERDGIIVVSGGEPLLQAKGVEALCRELDRPVHIETNGTRPPVAGPAWYSVSPKLLPSAGIGWQRAYDAPALTALATRPGAIKLVVDPAQDTRDDLVLALAALAACGWERDRVDLMPEGATPAALARNATTVAAYSQDTGCGLSPRLHVSELGGGRGV